MRPTFVTTVQSNIIKQYLITKNYVIILIVQLVPNTKYTNFCTSGKTWYSFETMFTCLWQIVSHFESRQRNADWNNETLNNSCNMIKHYIRLMLCVYVVPLYTLCPPLVYETQHGHNSVNLGEYYSIRLKKRRPATTGTILAFPFL